MGIKRINQEIIGIELGEASECQRGGWCYCRDKMFIKASDGKHTI